MLREIAQVLTNSEAHRTLGQVFNIYPVEAWSQVSGLLKIQATAHQVSSAALQVEDATPFSDSD